MTDTADDDGRAGDPETPAGDYEYDEAHGGGDDGPDVPAALRDEARRRLDLNPNP
ncbi:hypothetical protein [Actinoplanes utahensis]|uniref:hypothetical protein n=1 Tax=Actinoplanes utahensis TaxID=1869 RepID=UPI000A90D1EF|nr:hypothetical protein [Actinoplanes utahensis]GIF27700.1 hypothetical protein Aut01nite_06860 [Actinoplanes utahensis]